MNPSNTHVVVTDAWYLMDFEPIVDFFSALPDWEFHVWHSYVVIPQE